MENKQNSSLIMCDSKECMRYVLYLKWHRMAARPMFRASHTVL